MTAVVWRPGPAVFPVYGNPWSLSAGDLGWEAMAAGFTGRPELVRKLEIYQGVARLYPVAIAFIDKER